MKKKESLFGIWYPHKISISKVVPQLLQYMSEPNMNINIQKDL